MNDTQYLHVSRSGDLTGTDRTLYRFFETLPALLSIGTLVLFIVLSFVAPAVVAYFTIAFAAYWLFKTILIVLSKKLCFFGWSLSDFFIYKNSRFAVFL